MWGHLPVPIRASICSSIHLHPPGRGGAFLWGHVPAFLSSGGLRHRSPLSFHVQRHSFRVMRGRQQWGRVTPTLAPPAGQGGGRQASPSCRRVCPVGLRTTPWTQALPTSKPLGPFSERPLQESLSLQQHPWWPTARASPLAPLWSNSSFPENASAAELGSPGASQGSSGWALVNSALSDKCLRMTWGSGQSRDIQV